MNVHEAHQEYAYLSEVAEFWNERKHQCNGLCLDCHRFYGDLDAASIQLDNAVAAASAPYSAPSWLGGVR